MIIKETTIFSAKNGAYIPYFEDDSISKTHIDTLMGKRLFITVKNLDHSEVTAYFISAEDFQMVDSASISSIYFYSRGGVRYVDVATDKVTLTFEIHGKNLGTYYTLDTASVEEIDQFSTFTDSEEKPL